MCRCVCVCERVLLSTFKYAALPRVSGDLHSSRQLSAGSLRSRSRRDLRYFLSFPRPFHKHESFVTQVE